MIVYLHGFSSAAASRKANYLRQIFKTDKFYVPDYKSHHPRQSIEFLQAYLAQLLKENNQQQLMLIGSSLGGYYAQYLGSSFAYIDRVVLINPALAASSILAPYVGKHKNMVTGVSFEFTKTDLDELVLFDVTDTKSLAPTLLLVDEGDDVVDYHFAVQRYKSIGRVLVYPGGSHWFDHLEDAIPEILNFYETMKL